MMSGMRKGPPIALSSPPDPPTPPPRARDSRAGGKGPGEPGAWETGLAVEGAEDLVDGREGAQEGLPARVEIRGGAGDPGPAPPRGSGHGRRSARRLSKRFASQRPVDAQARG